MNNIKSFAAPILVGLIICLSFIIFAVLISLYIKFFCILATIVSILIILWGIGSNYLLYYPESRITKLLGYKED